MISYKALKEIPAKAPYKAGDVLLVVGELFGRGYANGLVDEAKRLQMTIIGTTVGRRDADGSLRNLTDDELLESEKLLGGKIINIPLEAGFDMESTDSSPSIVEQLKKSKPDEFGAIKFDSDFLQSAKESGSRRFRKNLAALFQSVEKLIPNGASIHIAHTMAGGIPRARVFMPLLNKIFKGKGDKFLPSADFWKSDLGKVCDLSFNEVTADTFRYILEESSVLRESVKSKGGSVAYSAYGYHGTEVLINGEYRWQSYTPYVQGYAKMRLEDIAAEYSKNGVSATVFNSPEIQTNSSALFLGVEISLYPLIDAIKNLSKENGEKLYKKCSDLLKDDESVENLLAKANDYLSSPIITSILNFETWPQHNNKEQAEFMLSKSEELMGMHKDQKNLICAELSKIVFESTGKIMLHASYNSTNPVLWLNHNLIAELIAAGEITI